MIQNRLRLALVLTAVVMVAEAAGGLIAHSLALLSDAAHMLSDVISLGLSWFALRIAAQPSTLTKTYGYHRIEIFAAFGNGILLLIMALGIGWEALQRLHSPDAVHSPTVMAVALLGLITNLCVIYFLRDPVHGNHRHDLNLKGAFYHVLGDTLASVAVLIGGAVMYFTQWYLIDAITALMVAALLLWGARNVIGEASHILLEGVPHGISVREVERELTALPEVKDIHELHIWCICSNIYALSTHALVNDQKVNQAEAILQEIKTLLREKFNITHSTIQFETVPCSPSDVPCTMKH